MKKEVALFTAGHLSSCPRLLKEAQLLHENGYSVSILYLESIHSISLLDKLIIEKNTNWKFYPIVWDRRIETLYSIMLFRLSKVLNINKHLIQSTSKALIDKALSIKADLYIAHHPSVLVAAAMAAKKYKAKYAYDIEDAFAYIDNGSFLENPDETIFNVEKKYIRGASFTTTASPLYSQLYIDNFHLPNTPIDVLNVFNINERPIEYKDRRDLKKISFYWYSQTVGLNRGLQDLFRSINQLPYNSFELHIRGMCTEEVKLELLNLVDSDEHKRNIYFHAAVSVEELELRNKEHDVGFALEASTSLNRDLCISNKILDYLRSGVMVVATRTKGHDVITSQLGEFAIKYNPGDVESLASQLTELINDPSRINFSKAKSIELAEVKYNWSKQSQTWLNKVKEVLS